MSERPHYHGHRQRLRERLAKDSTQLADYEILELLLAQVLPRQDTKPLAKEMLKRFGNLRGVMTAQSGELRLLKGFGPSLDLFWKLLAELRARFGEAPVAERRAFDSPQVVAELGMERIGSSRTEEFWLAMVDNRNRLIAWERVSKGTVDQAPVYTREVLTMALDHGASGMVMVHNHPGGDPRPSDADVELTKRIRRAAKDMGVRLLDHIVVTCDDWFSFQMHGLL